MRFSGNNSQLLKHRITVLCTEGVKRAYFGALILCHSRYKMLKTDDLKTAYLKYEESKFTSLALTFLNRRKQKKIPTALTNM